MRLLVFSDLDGTLLDHESYDHSPALPALQQLQALGAPVILASSKTAAEMRVWQERLGLTAWPAIVENGAALAEGAPDDRDYRAIRAALADLPPDLRAPFRGFGDMSLAEVAGITGLSPEAAELACRRAHSEPGLWAGDALDRAAFLTALAAKGIEARSGGRFLTLSFGGTKAGRMAELIARLRPDITIALGDAPNDREMIETADYGVIIRNDHGPGLPPLSGEAEGRIRRTTCEGPAGWREGIEAILHEIGLAEAAPATKGKTHG